MTNTQRHPSEFTSDQMKLRNLVWARISVFTNRNEYRDGFLDGLIQASVVVGACDTESEEWTID